MTDESVSSSDPFPVKLEMHLEDSHQMTVIAFGDLSREEEGDNDQK